MVLSFFKVNAYATSKSKKVKKKRLTDPFSGCFLKFFNRNFLTSNVELSTALDKQQNIKA